ncbi:D-alanyl-D-alanine carboxypeptidase [Streptomyces sp. NPDC058308]|uniref:D-alanyl-D-alanine carboxypeptidase n=1 Tax=Streptomyces sp. NPDC058308 TaxID=3346440 RepID=UPI0036E86C3F
MTRETPEVREDNATAVFSTKDVAGKAAGSDRPASEGDAKDDANDDAKGEAASGSDESGSASESESESAPKGAANGDARLRDAVAAWVATSDEETPEGGEPAGDEPSTGSDASAEADADADAADADADGGGAVDDDAPAKGGDAPAAVKDGAPAAKGDDAPAKSKDAPLKKDDAPAKGEATPAKGEATPAKGEATPAKGEATPAKDDDAPAKGDDPKSTGVDQATAVFKMPSSEDAAEATAKKPGKDVDQPTTMLKLGDRENAKNAKDTAKSETEAERTSKFVALKPLDEPSAKAAPKAAPKTDSKAAPKPEAKTAAPKAGPKTGLKGAAATTAAASAAASKPAPATPQAPPPVEPTTQQPRPPKPPIDLLAELTNTPPPPETPVRTAVRRVKIWTPLVLLMIVVFAVVQTVRPLPTPTLQLTAQESVSFEGGKPSLPWPGQGQAAMDVNGIGTFGTSGDQKPVPIASIAKVMTVYLILRDHPLKKGGDNGPKIPVDAAAQKHYETGKAGNESVVKVTEGQKITEYEALQAVMLPSANNIAKLLARWDTKSGSEDAFVEKMNKTAKELGMKNTRYTDPSGLDKTTVSTAEDLVKLGRAAMENPVFNEISRQPSYKDLNGDKQNNFFGLVPTVAIGIKTGTTTAAGGNILFAAEKLVDGKKQTIIGAALGQYGRNGVANIDEVTGVTRKLIEAGQDALTAKTIVKKGAVVGQVDDGLGGTTPVVATKDVSAVGWSGLTVKLMLDEEKGKTVPHTAKAGTEVGVLHVGDGKGKGDAVEVPVALQKDLAEPGFGAKLTRVG